MSDTTTAAPEAPDDLREYAIRGTLGVTLDPVLRNLYLQNRARRERANAIDGPDAAIQSNDWEAR